MSVARQQFPFTCVAPIVAGASSELRRTLSALAREHSGPASTLSTIDGLHFARFVVLDAGRDADGHFLPPALVFSSWHDGHAESHRNALATRAADVLSEAFSYCEGAPSKSSGQGLATFLQRHTIPALSYFNAVPRRTVRQLRLEQSLVHELRRLLPSVAGQDAIGIHRELRRSAQDDPGLRWLFEPSPRILPSADERAVRWLMWLVRNAPRLLLFFMSLPALRRAERRESGTAGSVSLEPPPAQAAADATQNAYNSVTAIKKGVLRRRALHLFLDLLGVIGSMRTDLSGIATMRFAHWTELDLGRRLLFCSVYDGSWESYMSDFIELAGWGLTGVWSNTVGFPPADWLVLNGARHEQGFRRFVRQHELETAFWYRRYPGSSCENIADASVLRSELRRERLSATEAAAWLSRF
jgi:hypothetical protein